MFSPERSAALGEVSVTELDVGMDRDLFWQWQVMMHPCIHARAHWHTDMDVSTCTHRVMMMYTCAHLHTHTHARMLCINTRMY